MKFKKIVVPQYIFSDELGEYKFQQIAILINTESQITAESFNQYKDEYTISSEEVEKMHKEAGQRFFNNSYKKILNNEYHLSPKEFNGIKLYLDVNGSELAKLLNLDKSLISRIINEQSEIQRDTMFLIMERLRNEIETPGITRAILDQLGAQTNAKIKELNIPATLVAEWIVRQFISLDDCITNLKLQKLLYYAQGLAVGRYNCRLMSEDFYAWEHGPVIKTIYHGYKNYQSSALPINPALDIRIVSENKEIVQILNDTINTYGKLGAWVLRDKTHSETPWVETTQGERIDFEKIKKFFRDSII